LNATVTKPESWKRVIEIEVPAEEVNTVFEGKLTKYRKEVKMPGFRQGKVPAAIIKSRFGDSIRAETIEELVQKSFEESCRDNNIVPISRPVIEEIKADKDAPLSFKVETQVDPEIEIKGYEKLKTKVAPNKIKPADVDKIIDDLRERMSTFSDVEREAKKGDFVSLEYKKVIVEGEERADIKSPQYPIEVGSSRIKEFDKGLIGTKAGEEVTIAVTFPKDYGDQEIAKKSGEFTVLINKVQEKAQPAIDAEFLKKLGDFATEEALRESIQKDLEARESERARQEAVDKAIDTLIKNNPFDIPPARIEGYIDYMLQQATQYARPGEEIPSREEMVARYNDLAIRNLKQYRIVDFIATKESIKATQEEVDARIQQLADQYQQPFDTIKAALRQNGTTQRIREDLREEKTLNFLLDQSVEA
jgi:trigger factor